MPLFAVLFSGLLGGLASFLAKFVTRKVAVTAAAIAALGSLYTVLLVVFNAAVSPLAAAAFSTSYGQFIGLAFPPMAGTCLAVIGSTWAACGVFRWQLHALSISVQA